jgi:DNA-binding CsgD family transcriptional regulator
MVGRDVELGELEARLRQAAGGQGRVVLLAGEAGIGKTRVARELQRRAQASGLLSLWSTCSGADLSLPYLPFLEAIGNHLDRTPTAELAERLAYFRNDLATLFPRLGTSGSASAWGLDAAQRRLRLFEGVVALLSGLSEQSGGLLFVIDDLHWADAASRELVDYLARRLRSTRCLLVGTYRTEEAHRRHPFGVLVRDWRRREAVDILDLRALTADQVGEMLRAIFGTASTRPETQDFLHERSDGNPFVLEEMLKLALDRGDIFSAEGHWQRREISEFRLPESVRESVLERLDRMSPGQVELLHIASVLGTSFEADRLAALAGPEANLEPVLASCVELQLLVPDDEPPQRYHFRHALTREAIYENMLAAQRRLLHGRVADLLGQRPDVAPIERCHHLIAAERWAEAVRICLEAAESPAWVSAAAGAAELYSRILPHAEDAAQRAEVQCRLGACLKVSVGPAPALEHLAQGVQALEVAGAHRAAAGYRLDLGRARWELGDPELARAEYESARQTLAADGPSEELAVAYIRLAGLHAFSFEAEAAVMCAERAIAIATAVGSNAARIWSYNFLGLGKIWRGEADEGIALLDRSYREARARGYVHIAENAFGNAIVLRNYHLRAREVADLLPAYYPSGSALGIGIVMGQVETALALGDLAHGLAIGRPALRLADEVGFAFLGGRLREAIAVLLCATDQLDAAREHLRATGGRTEAQERFVHAYYAIRALLDIGDLDAALAEAEVLAVTESWPLTPRRLVADVAVEALLLGGHREAAAVAVEQTRDDRPGGPWQCRMEGRVALARGETEQASQLLRKAGALFEKAGYRLEASRTRRGLADALRASGDAPTARAELRRVVEDGRAMGAALEVQRALESLGRRPPRAEVRAAGPLTEREREIAAMVARGLTAREIAAALVISVRTVEGHVDNIRNKLGMRSRAQIAAWVVARGLLRDPPPPST